MRLMLSDSKFTRRRVYAALGPEPPANENSAPVKSTAVVPFDFEGAAVRVVEIDGEAWFVGKDVAAVLGYVNPATALKSHCRGVQKLCPLQTEGGLQNIRVLGFSDVLRLIIGSHLPAAERFEVWVFEEVLPTIHKTGSYGAAPPVPQTREQQLAAARVTLAARRAAEAAPAKLPANDAPAPSTAMTIKLESRDGKPVANSKNIAAMFDKEHKDVLRIINGLEIGAELRRSFFIPNTTPDSYGRPQTTYDMTRDGFTLLAMGFTGPKALQFKLAYIKAFNEMEDALRGPAQAPAE
jgi:Rha family phage regulatory protein